MNFLDYQGLSKKYPTFGHKTNNTINITNLFNLLQNTPLANAHTFPSTSATFGNTS